MSTLIVTTSKGTKFFDAFYAIATRTGHNLIARIKDDRKLSQIAADFEEVRKVTVDGEDYSQYNRLTKVAQATPEEVSLILSSTL